MANTKPVTYVFEFPPFFEDAEILHSMSQIRKYNLYSWAKETTVGYCDTDVGCIYAAKNMHANNGITRAPNGTIYVADSTSGGLSILEPQDDHTLVLTDVVPVGMSRELRHFYLFSPHSG